MFIETSTTPSAPTSRRSARSRPRNCGRAIAQSAAEPNRSRKNTTPGGPSCGKSVFATAAPPWTEHAAASTSPTADARLSRTSYFFSESAAPTPRSAIPSTPRPVERDLRRAEEAEAVDRRAHQKLAGDEDPHRRGDAEAPAGVGDREHDQQAQEAAHQHPPRVMERVAVGREALPEEKQQHERDNRREERREGDRADDRDPVAELRHHRHLHRACEARNHGQQYG